VLVRSAAPRTTLIAAAIGLVALVLAGCGTPAGATDKSKTSGTITLKVNGRERSYLLEPATGDTSRKSCARPAPRWSTRPASRGRGTPASAAASRAGRTSTTSGSSTRS
jgi:hypothetical protein